MNEAVFLEFYARTAGPLFGYLVRLTGSRPLAEDLVQDAYLRLLSSRHLPLNQDHLRNYLFRIATNLARDHFRRADVEQRVGSLAGPSRVEAARSPYAGDVWSVLSRLKPRDRELLLLAYVEGLSHREIAEVTGLMRASVRPLLYRSRRRFAAMLRAAGLVPQGSETTV